MASTLLLDQVAWDLVLDAAGDIAVAQEPYALAQDAASACRTFLGECWWDTTIGVPYLSQVFGKNPTLAQLKELLVQEVNAQVKGIDTSKTKVFLTALGDRALGGQVQVAPSSGGATQVATFTTINPQGPG